MAAAIRLSQQHSCSFLRRPYGIGLLRCEISARLMTALGQKQTSRYHLAISALPPKADIDRRDGDVRLVPQADIPAGQAAPCRD